HCDGSAAEGSLAVPGGVRERERGDRTCTRIQTILLPGTDGDIGCFHGRPHQPSSGLSVITCQRAPATGSSVRGWGSGSACPAATPEERACPCFRLDPGAPFSNPKSEPARWSGTPFSG